MTRPVTEALPVYAITHEIRRFIVTRCETTLSWDQLRSPQVSQFLIKPIQQQIHPQHFSRATLYCLMANCLQFHKEAALHPGLSGSSRTRALVSELLAIKLLKEFTTRELIDALAYDFDPLQRQPSPIPIPGTGAAAGAGAGKGKGAGKGTMGNQGLKQHGPAASSGIARISCPKSPSVPRQSGFWLIRSLSSNSSHLGWHHRLSLYCRSSASSRTQNCHSTTPFSSPRAGIWVLPPSPRNRTFTLLLFLLRPPYPRRSVTLYDPRDASLFKLSRLRVPRYRQFLSTCLCCPARPLSRRHHPTAPGDHATRIGFLVLERRLHARRDCRLQ